MVKFVSALALALVIVPVAPEEKIGPVVECMMGTLETKPMLAQCTQLTLRLRDCTAKSAKRLSHHLRKAKLLKSIVVVESDIGCSNLVAVAIGAALRNGTGAPLETLSFENTPLQSRAVKAVTDLLAEAPLDLPLSQLGFIANGLDLEACATLGDMLAHKNVRHRPLELRLMANLFGGSGLERIVRGARINTGLHHLALAQNDLGDDVAVLASLLEAEGNGLAHLGLQHNGIGSAGLAALAAAIGGGGGSSALVGLDLTGNPLGALGGVAIADVLRASPPQLQSLVLNGCGLGDDGVRALAEGLAEGGAPSLVHLGLDANQMSDATALCAALPRGSGKMSSLHLSRNPLGDEGAASLGDCLGKQSPLRSLAVTHAEVGELGGNRLASVLDDGSPLQELQLRGNSLADDGATAMATALSRGSRLRSLGLGANQVGDNGAVAIGAVLKDTAQTALEVLELDANPDLTSLVGVPMLAGAALSQKSLRSLRVSMRNESAPSDSDGFQTIDLVVQAIGTMRHNRMQMTQITAVMRSLSPRERKRRLDAMKQNPQHARLAAQLSNFEMLEAELARTPPDAWRREAERRGVPLEQFNTIPEDLEAKGMQEVEELIGSGNQQRTIADDDASLPRHDEL